MSSCQGRDQWLEEILNLQDVMSYTQRIRDLFRKYGKVGLGVHLAIYTATLSGLLGFSHQSLSRDFIILYCQPSYPAGCYVAAERNAKLDDLLVKYGLLARECTGHPALF